MKARSFVLALVVLLAITSCYASVSQDALAKFSKWAQEKKIHTKFNLAYFENEGLGGVARTDILDGDTLVKIPRSVLVTLSEAKANAPIKDWPGVIEYEPLIYWILSQAADPNSEYRPYIDILPTDYSNFHPFYWTDDVWPYCDGTGLKEFVGLHRAAAAKSFELFTEIINEKYPNLFPAGFLTQDKYNWAYLAIQSRTWQIDDGGVRDIAVVPVADLLNHSPTAGGGGLIGDHFVVNATQDYSANDQVYDSYGAKSNFELLSVYGFLVRDNPVKALNLHFSFKENNLVHSIVEPLLRAQDPKYSTITIRENYVPSELLRAFRLSVMEFSELDYVNRALGGKPVSLKNELRAFRAAIKALSGLLEAYPTTEEEDLALGESGNLTANQQTALYLRISERSVAKNVILVVAKMWENILLEGQLFGEVSIE